MKKSLTTLSIIALATAFGFSLFTYQANADELVSPRNRKGVHSVSHHGLGYERMIEAKAKVLGISTSDLQQMLDSGKSFPEIVKDAGISYLDFHNKMREVRLEQLDEHLHELVEDGILSQSEADARLEQAQSGERIFNRQGRGFNSASGMRLHSSFLPAGN